MQGRILVFLMLITAVTSAQKKIIENVQSSVTALESEAHMAFLASDQMRGRDTGSPEIEIAANYISAQLKIFGVKPVQGDSNYFQDVRLEKIIPATAASLSVGSDVFKLKDDLLYINGGNTALDGEMIFIGYGSQTDFEKTDVKGKIVVALAGTNATTNAVQALLSDSPAKGKIAATHGAAALIEIMLLPGLPWQSLANFLSTERMVTQKDQKSIPHLYMKKTEAASFASFMESKKATGKLNVEAKAAQPVSAKNVAGTITGTDPALKNEWIVISAHYDHVGVKKNATPDSIFNGARDNAIGTVALLHAAKFFGKNPPKRSILFLAVTGEEKGLLGSEWYSNHPLIPLKQTVLNYNCDGAGYNDTTIVTQIDFNRTTVDEHLKKACQAFGLELKGDPAPEQNLYERSDNLNFAVKGVPAVDLAPGVKSFDKELFKYYHQPADEVSSLDMNYIEKFHRCFVYGGYLIANAKERPMWVKGDKFEEAGKKLYGK
ncbi:MAG TPA: M28 family peptidase [Chryseolinea sp.]|nr:M28 family peptidase [Chryseolinea sp.]